MQRSRWSLFLEFVGVELSPVTHKERILSGVGAFLGILFTLLMSRGVLDQTATLMVVSSMGASAVLLFGVPHGALSQPWPLVGGHLISAVVGVLCAMAIPNPFIAAPLAVALAMVAMHYARCIHPPGGATALTAVIGGAAVHRLGLGYVLAPVAINVVTMLSIAFAFNRFFGWRRYPAALNVRPSRPDPIPRESLKHALKQMDSFIDVSEEDLERIYSLAAEHARRKKPINEIDRSKQASR